MEVFFYLVGGIAFVWLLLMATLTLLWYMGSKAQNKAEAKGETQDPFDDPSLWS